MTQKQYEYLQRQIIFQYQTEYNKRAIKLGRFPRNYDYILNKVLSNPKLTHQMQSAIKKLHKEQLKEYKLNQAYGKEYLHYSEKPKQSIKTEYLPEEEEDDSDLLQEYYQPLTLEDVL